MTAAEQYRRRFLADMFTSVSASQMLHRARMFEWAAPRPGDFNGRASAAELAARTERCLGIAAAYRAKAEVLRRYGPPDFIEAEVAQVLGEVA